MRCYQLMWTAEANSWSGLDSLAGCNSDQTLVVLFGVTDESDYVGAVRDLVECLPDSHIVGCSSAGEISNKTNSVTEKAIVGTVYQFDHAELKVERYDIDAGDSLMAGKTLASQLLDDDLKAVFVLSDGLQVNGSELAKGFASVLPDSVPVTGGRLCCSTQWPLSFDVIKPLGSCRASQAG